MNKIHNFFQKFTLYNVQKLKITNGIIINTTWNDKSLIWLIGANAMNLFCKISKNTVFWMKNFNKN